MNIKKKELDLFYKSWKKSFHFEEGRSHLFIVRGFPGSGKSYFSKKLASDFGIIHIEPDQFITRGGKYEYGTNKYKYAIKLCRKFIYDHIDRMDIIISDVFPRLIDVMALIAQAEYANAKIEVIDLPYIDMFDSMKSNRHNVCEKDLYYMYSNYQKWKDRKEDMQ